jgi:acyl-CoA thioesterase
MQMQIQDEDDIHMHTEHARYVSSSRLLRHTQAFHGCGAKTDEIQYNG